MTGTLNRQADEREREYTLLPKLVVAKTVRKRCATNTRHSCRRAEASRRDIARAMLGRGQSQIFWDFLC